MLNTDFQKGKQILKYKLASTSKQKNQLSSEVKLLLWISFGLWIYSLLGLGFYATDNHPIYGLLILLLGTLFGWFAGVPFFSSFAVYANYFYLFALFRLTFGNKIPTTSVKLMLALASLTVLLKRVMINEAGGYASIDAWGWGAIWWGLSLITLTIATYTQNGKISLKKSLPITASIYAIVILPLLVLFGYQYSIANEQEKATYFEPGILGIDLSEEEKHNSETPNPYSALRILLTGGTAFSLNSFSHIKYTQAPKLPENSVLQINGNIDFTDNWSLMVDDLAFHLPSTFVHQGKLYQRQEDRHTYHFIISHLIDASLIKVAPFTNKIDYTLNLSPTQQTGKYRFTITDENKQNTFFQADMIKSGDYTYPFNSVKYHFNESVFLLDKPIEVSNKCPHQTSMTIEDTHIALSINNTNYMIVAENDIDKVKKQFQKYRIDDAYCSEKIVILPVKIMKTVNNLSADVENIIFLVFDKQNMQLIDEFNLYNNIYYQKHEQNKELTLKTIKPIIEHINDKTNNYVFTYQTIEPGFVQTQLLVQYFDYRVEL